MIVFWILTYIGKPTNYQFILWFVEANWYTRWINLGTHGLFWLLILISTLILPVATTTFSGFINNDCVNAIDPAATKCKPLEAPGDAGFAAWFIYTLIAGANLVVQWLWHFKETDCLPRWKKYAY